LNLGRSKLLSLSLSHCTLSGRRRRVGTAGGEKEHQSFFLASSIISCERVLYNI
jgi:hypothetical protein